jgi:hypothetical protein
MASLWVVRGSARLILPPPSVFDDRLRKDPKAEHGVANHQQNHGVLAAQRQVRIGECADRGDVTIRMPIRLQRRGGRKLIMTPEGVAAPARKPSCDETLTKALVQAHRWRRRIKSGRPRSMTDLAEQERVAVAYVCRLLPLTCLAAEGAEAGGDAGERAARMGGAAVCLEVLLGGLVTRRELIDLRIVVQLAVAVVPRNARRPSHRESVVDCQRGHSVAPGLVATRQQGVRWGLAATAVQTAPRAEYHQGDQKRCSHRAAALENLERVPFTKNGCPASLPSSGALRDGLFGPRQKTPAFGGQHEQPRIMELFPLVVVLHPHDARGPAFPRPE